MSKPHEHPSARGFPTEVLALSRELRMAMSSCLGALLPPGSFLLRGFLFRGDPEFPLIFTGDMT